MNKTCKTCEYWRPNNCMLYEIVAGKFTHAKVDVWISRPNEKNYCSLYHRQNSMKLKELAEMASEFVIKSWMDQNKNVFDKNTLVTQACSRFGCSKSQAIEILNSKMTKIPGLED